MENRMEQQLQNLIANANKILITSHISPDADAISSSLLLSETLRLNFPSKQVELVLEDRPIQDFTFLVNYENILFQSLASKLETLQPDIFIIVDANSFGRISRTDSDKINSYTKLNKNYIKTVVIDHHEPLDKDDTDIYINNGTPAATQEIYDLLFHKWGLKKPDGYAQTAMLGIVSDTLRFKYQNPLHRQTFKIVSDLVDAGANIEEIENRLEKYSVDQLLGISELAANIKVSGDHVYSYYSDEFTEDWQKANKSADDFKSAVDIFVNGYSRNIEDKSWGYVIYQEMMSGSGWYAVSFRSVSGSVDVSRIARSLGGGGHKPAAGAKLQASSVKEAIDKVSAAINQYPGKDNL